MLPTKGRSEKLTVVEGCCRPSNQAQRTAPIDVSSTRPLSAYNPYSECSIPLCKMNLNWKMYSEPECRCCSGNISTDLVRFEIVSSTLTSTPLKTVGEIEEFPPVLVSTPRAFPWRILMSVEIASKWCRSNENNETSGIYNGRRNKLAA